jgi:hypothetical protein
MAGVYSMKEWLDSGRWLASPGRDAIRAGAEEEEGAS